MEDDPYRRCAALPPEGEADPYRRCAALPPEGEAIKEEWEETMLWYRGIKETNNEAFIPLFFDKHRYLILKGGGGSGKSIFAGRKTLERVTTEEGHRWLVCRKVDRTLRESCFDQLKKQANDFYAEQIDYIPKGKSSEMYMRVRNGSEILFSGLDDVEKLKSIHGITGIWIEEASEITQDDFDQLDMRLRTEFPYYLQIIISFNPISANHWLKKRFFDRHEERARIHESTYHDNRFLPEENRKTLEGYRETNPYYYMVYVLNQWGVTGKTIFDGAALAARLEELAKRKAIRIGTFEYEVLQGGIKIKPSGFSAEKNGAVRIYREPEAGRPYVIGGDTAGDGSDWFVAQVLDNITGVQVATLRHQYDEDSYAQQLYCLGKYYNDALIAVETNFSTYPVKLLNLMGYNNLYIREVEDNYLGKIRTAYGFATTPITRPIIIAELVRVMREGAGRLNDEETILEMMSFVRNEKLRPEAEAGAHDDTVMALAIAYYVRPQQRMSIEATPEAGTARWSKDMWEDFNRASGAEREMLLKMWGRPR